MPQHSPSKERDKKPSSKKALSGGSSRGWKTTTSIVSTMRVPAYSPQANGNLAGGYLKNSELVMLLFQLCHCIPYLAGSTMAGNTSSNSNDGQHQKLKVDLLLSGASVHDPADNRWYNKQ